MEKRQKIVDEEEDLSWKEWLKEVGQALDSKPLSSEKLIKLSRSIPDHDFKLDEDDGKKRIMKLCGEVQPKLFDLHKRCVKKLAETRATSQPHQMEMIKEVHALISPQTEGFDCVEEVQLEVMKVWRNLMSVLNLVQACHELNPLAEDESPNVVGRVTEAFEEEFNSLRQTDDLSVSQLEILAGFISQTLCGGLSLQ